MDKWDYVRLVSQMSNEYGNLLLDMMNECEKNDLYSITEQEAKEFYNSLILGEEYNNNKE